MSQLVPFLNFGLEDSHHLQDTFYGAHCDSIEQQKMFLNFEGYSGVPTRTTPTLTPTTLRNIEQTFIELQSETESHENEAGFVPPLVHSIGNNQYIPASEADIYNKSNLWQQSLSQSSSDSSTRPTPPVTPKNGIITNNAPAPQSRRNMGGRKPAKELHLSPEEEERRRIRRERNKAAAARCRKRRVDHTNQLVEETERLEQKKQQLQDELKEIRQQIDDLQTFLELHKNSNSCFLNTRSSSPQDIKPYDLPHQFNKPPGLHERIKSEIIEPLDDDCFPPPSKKLMLSQAVPAVIKPSRPRTLDVNRIRMAEELPGIVVTTPSAGIQFNFDSLMVGGTGLTPVSAPLAPTCSTQIRIPPTSIADITSPDSCGPPKLVSL
ncbi:transcription factor kayak isoform X2 [Onthophagus taurus]|uniref:transcription factor kayak isoform X2 n=1 Tax=Onthophagus taurus TaxID=166361 RepID=UPI000C20E663|nr:transcription factor kayak isoform X2 [Onthophagus taurus]